MREKISAIEKNLGYTFKSTSLLKEALTHRSAQGKNNERLEFLGDAVLELAVRSYLFKHHRYSKPGDLTRLKVSLVRESTLAEIAKRLNLGSVLILGKGERQSGGSEKESILAGALEALIGAIYLESSFETACKVVEELIKTVNIEDTHDYKTELQNLLQTKRHTLPEYQVLGTDTNGQFVVGLFIEGELNAKGTGPTIKKAEQEAAKKVIEKMARALPSHPVFPPGSS